MNKGSFFLELEARFLEYQAAKGIIAQSEAQEEVLSFIAEFKDEVNFDPEPGEPDMNGPSKAELDEIHFGYQKLK